MKNVKIEKTYNYNKFSFYATNRPIRDCRKLTQSIQQADLTPHFPILVDRQFRIIDGQHRFVVCEKLRMPVYYTVYQGDDVDVVMMLLNSNQSAWRQDEYLNFQSNKKGGCYKELQVFNEKNNLGISNSMVIFPAEQINSDVLKKGEKNFGKNPMADDIVLFLNSEEFKYLKFRKTRNFVLAICKAFEKYNKKQLNKLKKNSIKIPMCANYKQYLDVFDNIV